MKMKNAVPAKLAPLALALVVALGVGAPLPASAGALAGGATEITQLANEFQLIMSYVQQVEAAENTLASAKALKQQLKQMDPSTLAQLNGGAISQVEQLAQLDGALQNSQNKATEALGVLGSAITQIQQLKMSPSEYLQQRAQLAATQGGAYAASMQADQQKLQQLQSSIAELQQAASAAPGVTSNIQGFQQLLSSGTRVQAQLVSLNDSVTHANLLAAQEARTNAADHQRDANATQEEIDRRNNGLKAIQNRTITVPPVSSYTNLGGSGGN